MDFFKSVFSDEPEPESDPSKQESESKPPKNPDPKPAPATGGGVWSFGGLIKTLSTKSESVIETYRRDLKEFGSGLRKEIEVAQGSLENVTHKFDELSSSVLKGTTQIISQGKEAILAVDNESETSDNTDNKDGFVGGSRNERSLSSKRYSRFEAQLRGVQGDAGTYCEEPEDSEDYRKWKLEFDLGEKREERERLVEENGAVGGLFRKVVPDSVDEETFWCRYYYRVFKLEQAEALRANLVQRAISREEEELSWDVDDDDGEKEEQEENGDLMGNEDLGNESSTKVTGDEERTEIKEMHSKEAEGIVKKSDSEKPSNREPEQNVSVTEEKEDKEEKADKDADESKREKILGGGDNVAVEKVDLDRSKEKTVLRSDEIAGSEGKSDNGESSKDSEFSVVSSHHSIPEEEDLGWDEIEDLSSIDEKKVSHSASTNKVDLKKRLSAAEEEEDLSWDIEEEDDDDHVKA